MSQSFVRSSTSIPANTSVTEKRTVITTSSGLSSGFGGAGVDDDDSPMYYRSSITPRQTSITRTSLPTSPLRTMRTVEISSAFPSLHMPLGSATVAATGVISFKSNREKEKKDMRDLNERFANYIEKVRFLEAQNKKLASELEQLRSHWGKETNKIKLMYETELTEARKLIDDTNKEKSRLQLRVGQLEEQLDDVMRQLDEAKKWRSQDRETINKLNQQVSELEGEVRMLRRTNDSLDTERQRDKATINRLQEELEKLRIDLSNETIARLDAENKYQTLLEEMEFLKSVHEQELKELSALAYRDTTAENREFWKNELSQAIRDIQQEYDMKVDQIRGEMETFYNLKVQEFRTGATKQNMEVTHAREETKKLHKQLGDLRTRNSDLEARNAQLEKQYQDMLREMEQKDHEHVMEINSLKEEMNKLRAELEAMLIELQILMDAKLSLELEIAAYRKLLEGEETRVGLRSVVEQTLGVRQSGTARLADIINVAEGQTYDSAESSIHSQEGDSQLSMKMMRGEVSAKTTYQRTANGPVSIAEANPEGKFILIENNSSGGVRKEVNLDGWKLQRIVDNNVKKPYVYTFRNFVLKPSKNVKIFARSLASQAGPNDLVFRDADTWGAGAEVVTTLINEKGEEKASHIQKTNYSQ
uniref:Neurofilament protein NF70 n=1 Tax=Cornu aspersum TaxID=6535 RepID=Q25017_CORAP|nr:neurofilament protein NF70 [Cornu aspersum]